MNPKLSLLVTIGESSRRAEDTLYSLSARHQRNVTAEEYEIIVVETASPSSFSAFEFAYRQSRAPLVGFVDGACLVTSGLIEHALAAQHLAAQPLIVAPAYLPAAADPVLDDSYDQIDWKNDADDLFSRSRFSDINENGYLCGVTRAALFFCARRTYDELRSHAESSEIRTCDELFGKLCRVPECRLIVLAGEACFGRRSDGHSVAATDAWQRVARRPLLFGMIPERARPFLKLSLGREAIHAALSCEAGREQWPHEHSMPRAAEIEPVPSGEGGEPLVSIIVLVVGIPGPAENTLYSLCARYQRNVRERDYEILVIEPRSSAMLGRERALGFGRNVQYFEQDAGTSTASALQFGIAHARADMLGILLDGARLATPGIIEQALLARRVHDRVLCVVPGYHLKPRARRDANPLDTVAWRESGYRLFEIAAADQPPLDSVNSLRDGTCLFCPKACWDEIRALSEVLAAPPAGAAQPDLFEMLSRLDRMRLVALWSEGTFHQPHEAITVSGSEGRSALTSAFFRYVMMLRSRQSASWTLESLLLGSCAAPATEILSKATWLAAGAVRSTRSEPAR